MSNNPKEIIQFEFWNECKENRCKFCSLAYTANDDNVCDPNRIRTPEEKRFIINQHINYLANLDWNKFDQISFQGGEIMNGYSLEYIKEYDTLISNIIQNMEKNRLKKLYLITSLKFPYENSLLEYTQRKFRENGFIDNLMIGTSWDLKYRFTPETERIWWTNLGKVKRGGSSVHCTTILSQFFIEAYMNNDPIVQRIMKIFPGRLFDLIGTIGDRHSPMLPPDFLPKRSSFLSFCLFLIKNNYPLWRRHADQSGRRATHVYRPITDSIIWRDVKNHTSNDLDLLSPCGHFVYCRSYSDSDECYACDMIKLLDMEKGAME